MTPKPLLTRIVLLASVACVPLCAQTPLFTDGGAFGGSKVFSEGMNPLGNQARVSEAPAGYYFTYVDGDQRAKDNKSILSDAASADPAAASSALNRLANAPWALRTRGYGFAAIKSSATLALTREELNGIMAHTDLRAADLGASLGANGSYLDGRRATVDRLSLGGGGPVDTGMSWGGGLRLERWAKGEQTVNFASQGGFGDPDSSLLGTTATTIRTLNVAVDLGMTMDLADGVRIGATADQLNAKHLWDVYLQPQFRAGLQIDLGHSTKVSVEGDVNAAARMPFPEKQQALVASLRFAISPATVFILGAEQRKIDTTSVTSIGATLQINTSALLLSFGFQAGQDNPMKGLTLMVK